VKRKKIISSGLTGILIACALMLSSCGLEQETVPQTSTAAQTQEVTEIETETTAKAGKAVMTTDLTKTTQASQATQTAQTPLQLHGALSVTGTQLMDAHGKPFQLKGVSTHGIAWFPQYVNQKTFQTLRDDWGANLIRLAMYTGESGGYCSGGDQAALKKTIDTGVQACTDLGMYCIIDWHILSDGNPEQNEAQAKAFFTEMSKKYADHTNIIYEICNEPNGGVTWQTIKTYADQVIPVIRQNAPGAVILVGTPTWSQDVDQVAGSPVAAPENVMYVLHFYAGTHKEALRAKADAALKAGTPLFISEFGICDASGNGGINLQEAEKWKTWINTNQISYAGWNLSNKAETSAVLKNDCSQLSDWQDSQLSDSGRWLKNMIHG
jgi:endoglucanase